MENLQRNAQETQAVIITGLLVQGKVIDLQSGLKRELLHGVNCRK